MKLNFTKYALFFSLVFLSSTAFAQNKSLGVGTATPNTNAALHVESPTNNQGLIMPRLTTVQRNAMTGILTAADEGLMLYDTDLNAIYIWTGTAWKSGSGGLSYPYKDSVTTSPGAGVFDVFALKYNAPQNARVLRVESISPTNQSSAISAQQQGLGIAGFFEQANDTSSTSALWSRLRTNRIPPPGGLAPVAVYGEATGIGGLGAAFWTNNPNNYFPALYTRTIGTGHSALFEITNPSNSAAVLRLNTQGDGHALFTEGRIVAGQFIGDGSQLSGLRLPSPYVDTVTTLANGQNALRIVNNNTGPGNFGVAHFENMNPQSGFSAIFGRTNSATNGVADFIVSNPANNNDALGLITNGVGTAIRGNNTGQGTAAAFANTNATNPNPVLILEQAGTGDALFTTGRIQAGQFVGDGSGITNLPPVSFPFTVSLNEPATLFEVINQTGQAARFEANGADNTTYAVYAENNNGLALSAAIYGNNTGNGFGVFGQSSGEVFGSAAVYGLQTGAGDAAGAFRIDNPSSNSSALYGETNGNGAATFSVQLGNGRAGQFQINNASNGEAALRGFTNGMGNSGFFTISNPSNSSPGIFTETNGLGPAIFANNSGDGDGFAGLFTTTDPGNSYPAIQATSQGLGSTGVRVFQNAGSEGGGIDVYLNNTNNSATGLSVNQYGLGPAATFQVDNPSSDQSAISAFSNAAAPAVSITGSGDGGGLFALASEQDASAISAFKTQGGGNSITAGHNGDDPLGPGNAIYAFADGGDSNAITGAIVSSSGGGNAIVGVTSSDAYSHAGFFLNNSSSNPAPVVFAESISSGAAISAENSGFGPAGQFNINEASSSSAAVFGATNGTGATLFLNHTGLSGNVAVFQSANSNVARIDKAGRGYFNDGTQNNGADIAELFDVEGNKNEYEPGDVLVISEKSDRTVEKSSSPISSKVAGVYATKPGIRLTERNIDESTDDLVPMGVVGVIPTKVCLENGPIKRGDLLVTSSKQGHAMKAMPVVINGIEIYPTGAILGKALENFESAESGLIKVLVNVK